MNSSYPLVVTYFDSSILENIFLLSCIRCLIWGCVCVHVSGTLATGSQADTWKQKDEMCPEHPRRSQTKIKFSN